MANALMENMAGYPILDFIADQRDAGKSWQQIADEIKEATEGVVDLGRDTVRRWLEASEVAA